MAAVYLLPYSQAAAAPRCPPPGTSHITPPPPSDPRPTVKSIQSTLFIPVRYGDNVRSPERANRLAQINKASPGRGLLCRAAHITMMPFCTATHRLAAQRKRPPRDGSGSSSLVGCIHWGPRPVVAAPGTYLATVNRRGHNMETVNTPRATHTTPINAGLSSLRPKKIKAGVPYRP